MSLKTIKLIVADLDGTLLHDDKSLDRNYICLFDYLFISSQMSAKPYFIGSTGILLLW